MQRNTVIIQFEINFYVTFYDDLEMTLLTKMFNRMLLLLTAFFIVFPLMAGQAHADEVPGQARDISGVEIVLPGSVSTKPGILFDMNLLNATSYYDGAVLKLTYIDGIGSLYFVFDVEYDSVTLTNPDTGESVQAETDGMLHWYVNLLDYFEKAPQTLDITFDSGAVKINELRVFTEGEVPDWVQRWDAPADADADLLLLSTHGDDEQMFFAGILPYYAGELNYKVQVAYFTNHRNMTTRRCHEMLDGLWAVGVRNYPVFGPFPDYFTNTLQNAYDNYRNAKVSEKDMLDYVVELLRRFKPYVVVGHDVNGEYGHGVHMLYTDLLFKALDISADTKVNLEMLEKYGAWDVPKTYIHLYPERRIVMDWDQPLSRFDGMTAYEVTRDLGFSCHKTQLDDFRWYFASGKTAADIPQYSPCEYGLYRSNVGEDTEKEDFFENIDWSIRKRWSDPEEVPEEETLPPETEAPIQEAFAEELTEPEETEPAPAKPSGNWLAIPGVAAVVLVLFAAVIALIKKDF